MTFRTACLSLACLAAVSAVDVPAPAKMPDDRSYVVAVVPDLRASVAHIEAAAKALGVPVPPGMLLAQIGGALGDPQLASLGKGPLVAVLAPGVPVPSWAVIIPTAQPDLITAAAARMGMSAEAVAGQVVLSQTIDGVDMGKALAPQAAALAPAGKAPDLRLLVAGDRLASTYLPFLMGLMQNMPRPPGTPAPRPETMAAVSALLRTLAGETGLAQVDLDISADGLRIDTIAAPRAGGVLAKGLVAPAPAPPRSLASRFGNATDGHLTMSGRVSPALLGAFAELTAKVAEDQQVKALVGPDLVAFLRDAARVGSGEFVARQGVGGVVTGQEALYGINDASAARGLLERVAAMTAKGPLADFYASLGMGMKLELGVRQAPGGIRVDRMTITVDPAKQPPGQADMMAKMFVPAEVAVGADAIATANTPAVLDQLLGAGRGPCSLAAEKSIGAGWDGYIDYDFGMQMRNQAKLMEGTPGAPMAAVLAAMPVGHPLTSAWAIRDGRMRMQVVVPMAFAADMKQFFEQQRRAMGPQQRRQRNGGDGKPPVDGPATGGAPPAF